MRAIAVLSQGLDDVASQTVPVCDIRQIFLEAQLYMTVETAFPNENKSCSGLGDTNRIHFLLFFGRIPKRLHLEERWVSESMWEWD